MTPFLRLLTICLLSPWLDAGPPAQARDAKPARQDPSEDDWWLPDWVEPKPGVIDFYGRKPDSVPDASASLDLLSLRWKDVNPADGVYDWTPLEAALAKDGPLYLRLENSHVVHCPDWLAAKYPDLPASILRGDKPQLDNWDFDTGGTFYPPWHPGVRGEFQRLLKSFGAKGFGDDPRLRFLYIPGAWAWGEHGLDFIDEMSAAGMTPETYLDWWTETLDAYVAAVGPENRGKLMYTGHDYLPNASSEDSARKRLWNGTIGRKHFIEVMRRGGSTRWGLLEKFDFMNSDLPNYGLPAVEIGGRIHQVADETNPLLSDPRRLIGSENEELDNSNIPWSNYYQLKMTALRSLSLRVNRVFTNAEIWEEAPELHEYLLKSLDRRPADSPDAWCALRSARDVYQEWSRYDSGWRGEWWYDNWERWLWQREVEGEGRTVATHDARIPVRFNEMKKEARRTDLANGNDSFHFWVEDRFLHGGSHAVWIKVTYLDENDATWWIEYDAANGNPAKRTAPHTNRNDGRWRTITFAVDDAAFEGRQPAGSDFRIHNGGEHDLTLRFVRVIRLNAPDPRPSP